MAADSQVRPRTDVPPGVADVAWPLAALLLGGALSFSMFVVSSGSERRRVEDEFDRSAAALVSALEAHADDSVRLLDSLAALWETSESIDREQFELFAAHLFQHHDGIQALEWVPRVAHRQREAHEQQAAAQGMAGYAISERGAGGDLVPAAEREEYLPVYFVEPLRGNEPAVGYDLASDPARLAAITLAVESGDIAGTGRVRLLQEQGEQFGILVVHPVYSGGSVPDSVAARRNAVRGFMLLVLRVSDLVESAIAELGGADIVVALYDESGAADERFLYRHAPGDATEQLANGTGGEAQYTRILQVASRTWRVVGGPLGGSLSARTTWLPWGLLVSGLVGTLLLAGVVMLAAVGGRHARLHAAAISEANTALQRHVDANARLLEVTQRKEAEARRFALLVEYSDDFVCVASLDGEIRFLNRAGRELVGLDPRADVTSLTINEFLTEEGRRSAAETEFPAIKVRGHWSGEKTLRHFKTGESIPVSANSFLILDPETGDPVGMATVQRDIRERKRALEELYQTQKLESLGVLAGGVAHDFNNLLVAVLGNADLARRSIPPESPAQGLIEQIETAAQRLAELSNQMLAYTGKGHFVVEPVDMSKLVGEMSRIVAASVSKKAAIEYRLEADLPAVEADATQLRQVVLNLIVNASEALGDETGSIEVSTGVMSCGRDSLSATYVDDHLPAGDYVFVEVADTGSGMDAETQERVFEPFFSTKFAGRGLGLAAALGIVRSHKGAVSVASEPGAGTTFRILLPASTEVSERSETVKADDTCHGSGLVLLVDDDEMVRDVAERMLRRLGFDVISAVDGREAVDSFARHRAEIVAVLLDRTMPVLDGLHALREIRTIDADIPVILSSGHARAEGDDSQATGFVKKPYTLAALQDALRLGLN